MYNTEYTFRWSSCIPTTISWPSVTIPISRAVPAPASVPIPIPIPSPVSVPVSVSVFRPVVSAAREVNVVSILRGCQSLLQGRRFVSRRISRKPFSSTLDHNPGMLDFAIAPFVLLHRPALDVPEKVIFVFFRSRPRIQSLHLLTFLLPSLFSDVNGK